MKVFTEFKQKLNEATNIKSLKVIEGFARSKLRSILDNSLLTSKTKKDAIREFNKLRKDIARRIRRLT
jgi:hypothetical protein